MAGFGVLHATQLIGHAARLLYFCDISVAFVIQILLSFVRFQVTQIMP